ncbi:MAG TPA: hypothetical protein VLH09_01080 [Bryobacteraceae bacterium]|nr:hypothetical protein [Bryobacteraceae bacterium]
MRAILAATLLANAALAQTGTRPVTPLKATVVRTFSKLGPDGALSSTAATGTYYRDSAGRTRLELGNSVTISDPAARTTVLLDLGAETARILGPPASTSAMAGAPPSGGPASAPVITSQTAGASEPVRSLGTMHINGFLASGFRGEAVFPAGMGGREFPTRVVSEMWRADELRLRIRITNTESAIKPGGDEVIRQTVEEYRDIVKGANVVPALFQIPPGFKLTSPNGPPPNAP